MSAIRILAAGTLSCLCGFLVVNAAGCGSDAVGIDHCRTIEEARCEAGAYCGVVDDIDACKRYYRDQCLHGLSNGDTSTVNVDRCVKTIHLAGACAKKNGAGAKLSSCTVPPSAAPNGLTTACGVVNTPQQTDECAFLSAAPPEAGADALGDARDAADAATTDAASDAR